MKADAKQAARELYRAENRGMPGDGFEGEDAFVELAVKRLEAFAAARVREERERIAEMIAAAHHENIKQGSNRVYGLVAVLHMLNLQDQQPNEVRR